MKNNKGLFSFIRNNKKISLFIICIVFCIIGFLITGALNTKETGSDDIPIHDGDVLVTSDDVSELDNNDTYLQELRATLDMERNKIIAMLSDSEGTASTPSEKDEAAKEKIKLMKYMEQEKTIETLIKNKGLPEAFVVITDNSVNVTVNTEDLDQATVTKICEIIMRQTDRKASEIVVQDIS